MKAYALPTKIGKITKKIRSWTCFLLVGEMEESEVLLDNGESGFITIMHLYIIGSS